MTQETPSFARLNSHSHTRLTLTLTTGKLELNWNTHTLERVDAACIYRGSRGGAMSAIHVLPTFPPFDKPSLKPP